MLTVRDESAAMDMLPPQELVLGGPSGSAAARLPVPQLNGTTPISELSLIDLHVGLTDAIFIGAVASANTALTSLTLHTCVLPVAQLVTNKLPKLQLSKGLKDEDVAVLATCLAENTSLESLDLSAGGLGEKAGVLLGGCLEQLDSPGGFNRTLSTLKLNENRLEMLGLQGLLRGLVPNGGRPVHPLTTLHIARCAARRG
eukprot:gene14896-17610_t